MTNLPDVPRIKTAREISSSMGAMSVRQKVVQDAEQC